jgi:predicted Zn-dependent protease
MSVGLIFWSACALLEFYILGDVSRASMLVTSLVCSLPMSRRNEIEADSCGIYFAGEAGFKPEAAIGV